MGRYLVVNLFSDPVRQYHRELVEKISDSFGVKPQKIGAHMTLIPPFESEDISEIQKISELFVKENRRIKMTVGGIGSFRDNVIFLKIAIEEKMHGKVSNFMTAGIGKTGGEEQLNLPHVFHCTLVSRRISHKFEAIMSSLECETHVYSCYLDNISIMKWDEDLKKWILKHQFHLKP